MLTKETRLTLCWLPGGDIYVKPKERSISSLGFDVRGSAVCRVGDCNLSLRIPLVSLYLLSAAGLLCFIRVWHTAHAPPSDRDAFTAQRLKTQLVAHLLKASMRHNSY